MGVLDDIIMKMASVRSTESEHIKCPSCGVVRPLSAFKDYADPSKMVGICNNCQRKQKRHDELLARRVNKVTEKANKQIAHIEKQLEKTTEKCSENTDKESATELSNSQENLEKKSDKTTNNETKNNMEDYTYFDFGKRRRSSVDEGNVCISNRKGNYYVLLSADDSEDVQRLQLNKLRIRLDNVTGDIHMLFNKSNGVDIDKNRKPGTGIRIRCKEMVQFLVSMLGLGNLDDEELYHVRISRNLANSDDYVTYKLLKKK